MVNAAPSARAQLTELKAVRGFILGGRAVFTLVSKKTGTRFTYRVKRKDVDNNERVLHFVSVLTGPDNTADYTFLGTIFDFGPFKHGKKSKIALKAPSERAFTWFWVMIQDCARLSPDVEFWHEGRCGRCGRALTDPTSISSGLGPVCASKGA